MKKLILIICLSLILGCATAGKLSRVELDMSKPQLSSAIGRPTTVRGSMTNKYGEVIEVWEYLLYKTGDDVFMGWQTPYWFFFCDGKLVKWGQAGDWQTEADRIYEIRFKELPPDSSD